MKLLFAADTVYTRCGENAYGLRVFGQEFFEDYLKVFSAVTICARVQETEISPVDRSKTNSDSIRFVGVPNIHGWRWIVGLNGKMRAILEEAISEADAVVARVPSTMGAAACRLAHRQGKPFLAEVVGDPWDAISNYGINPIYSVFGLACYWQFKRFMKQVDLASYVSRRVLAVRYPVGKGIETEEYSSIRLPDDLMRSARRYDVPPEPLHVMCLLSFLGYKRHIDLILACDRIKKRDISFVLHLVGDGPTKERIESVVDRLGLKNHVVFHGYVANRDELFSLIDSCHMTVLPSAQEGLPRSMLEGMARGLGAIGSDVGGIPDLTRPSESFHVGAFRDLADILQDVATDSERLTRMSEHAVKVSRQYTESVLSPRRVGMYQLLAEIAGKTSSVH